MVAPDDAGLCRLNIGRLQRQLADERDVAQRARLIELIGKEQGKLDRLSCDGGGSCAWRPPRSIIQLRVVRESFGWSVRLNNHTTSPFRRKDAAIAEAHRMAEDIRRHGQPTEVTVEDSALEDRGDGAS